MSRPGEDIVRTWIIVTVVVVAVLAASAFYLLRPNPNVGDESKLERTYSVEEQRRLDTVTVTGAELAAATCLDGARCYVAVQDVVYDMSGFPSWIKQGRHHGLQAGTDATAAFVRSGHARDKLQSMPVVGRLHR
ncbi:cytochrome b5 domain-containing protein [Arsenicicoccus cauae]|uniref:cytochrome b5 domain-containing protein n=1 Tax=Arsenicicoccus cauae TaxID=2663847 RepID=UPI00370D7523